jgi:copper resistance protein B
MGKKNNLKTASLAIALGLIGTPALAQEQGGFTPEFTDDATFTYLEAEVDYTPQNEGQLRWDAEAWYGGDYQKWWLRTEGETHDGELEEAQLQLLYGRYLAPFWDWRAGLRHDFEPRSLNYVVLGVKGLAPYRLETDASLYLSEDGDLSAVLEAEYQLLFTQRLIGEPYIDLELFAQDVPELDRAAGLSEVTAGLRVRYEIKRELAPYLDVSYSRLTGGTAGIARAAGEDTEELAARVGLRAWF